MKSSAGAPAVCRSAGGRGFAGRAAATKKEQLLFFLLTAPFPRALIRRAFFNLRNFMSWIYLFLAGAFEIAWVVALKYSHGFTRLAPSAAMVVAMLLSMGLLALAVRALPLGMSYAIWTGIGAVGAVLSGILLFGEPSNPLQIFFLSLIIIGIVGVKVASPH